MLRGFFNPKELEELAPLLRKTTADHAGDWEEYMQERTGSTEKSTHKQFIRVFNLVEKEPRLAELLYSPRLAKAARDLEDMAGGVRFYQAQSFFKESGDTGSMWHADNYACPLDTSNQLTTAWLPFVEVERDMGPLAFARGSHLDSEIPEPIRALALATTTAAPCGRITVLLC
eukprot:COSAG03_NODE_1340_length_4294_cov_90.195471_3_plen_173_part_00